METILANFASFPYPLLAVSRMWYCVPLIVSVSLVYGATRHEYMSQILEHSLRFGTWVITFMLAIFAVIFIASWFI